MKYFVQAHIALMTMQDVAKRRLASLRTDQSGVVSFEYIIVAACIVGAVAAAFGTGGAGAISTALTNGITKLVTAFQAAA